MTTAQRTAENELHNLTSAEYMQKDKESLVRTIHSLYGNIKQQQRAMQTDRLLIAFLQRTLKMLRKECGWPYHKIGDEATRASKAGLKKKVNRSYMPRKTKERKPIFKKKRAIMKLYHGTNIPTQKFSQESCFTESEDTAKSYAHYWTEAYGGEPTILLVDAEFEWAGGADEWKLADHTQYTIVEKKPMEEDT